VRPNESSRLGLLYEGLAGALATSEQERCHDAALGDATRGLGKVLRMAVMAGLTALAGDSASETPAVSLRLEALDGEAAALSLGVVDMGLEYVGLNPCDGVLGSMVCAGLGDAGAGLPDVAMGLGDATRGFGRSPRRLSGPFLKVASGEEALDVDWRSGVIGFGWGIMVYDGGGGVPTRGTGGGVLTRGTGGVLTRGKGRGVRELTGVARPESTVV
jgi:hypothetical protein